MHQGEQKTNKFWIEKNKDLIINSNWGDISANKNEDYTVTVQLDLL